MTAQDTHPNIQAVQRVYENEQPASSSATTGLLYLVCQPDASSGKDILLWDDVLDAFEEDVIHIRSGAVVLPFLKGLDFKKLDPFRIAAVPGAILDVVIRGQPKEKESSLGSLQMGLPSAHQQGEHNKKSNSISLMRLPQESTSTTAQDITVIIMNAALGDMHAQNALGEMFKDGRGVHLDYQAAMDWYLKAANQGHADAQNNTGWLYQYGHGVPQDYPAAMDWFLKSANQGNASAQLHIGHLHEEGLGVPKDYSAAVDWYLKAAHQGNAAAHNNIGMLYIDGLGVPQDYSQAMFWCRKAADQGNVAAQTHVGWMYEHGMGVSKDRAEAIDWYRKATAEGDEIAKARLDRLQPGLFNRLFM